MRANRRIKMKVKIAILGVGRWGVHWLRNFLCHPQADLVAIIDPCADRLADCRAKFAIADSDILFATDWQALQQKSAIDAIVVATPAATHYALVKEALKQGYHVLAEKPLALNVRECLELTRLAQKQQRLLFVDRTYLYHPAVKRGQQAIASGQLGKLRYGYASRTHLGPVRQDVDVLWDLAIHDLTIFNGWLGETPSGVSARGKVWLKKNLYDLVWVTLIYPSGFQAEIHLCWLNPDKQRRLCVVGEQGSLIFDEMSAEATLTLQHGFLEQQDEQFIAIARGCEVLEFEKTEPLKEVCDRFLESIQKQNYSLSSNLVDAQLIQVLSCLSASLQQQGAIVSVPSLGSRSKKVQR
jgi:predicted dehydrogenase